MCGIVGVTGSHPALPVLLDGLSRLEYRGYDSAGVALHSDGALWLQKRQGRLEVLADSLADAPSGAGTGIGHTRWATHGPAGEKNAHPHRDCTGSVAIVHNGIVENHHEWRKRLEAAGHVLSSDTDTEVLAHIVEEQLALGRSLGEAMRNLLERVRGSLALAAIYDGEPDLIVAARRGSPLILGRAAGTGLVASDIPALAPHSVEVSPLGDEEVGEIRPDGLWITDASGRRVHPERRGVGFDVKAVGKGSFPDFMLKEIYEQPKALTATLGGRRSEDERSGDPALIGLDLQAVRRMIIVGCGTSLHAGMAARPALERWAGIPVECEMASEFPERDFPFEPGTLVVGVSQSGETIDTLYAMRQAREQGAALLSICNVADSAIPREADAAIYTKAGPEIGVAATKTHSSQLAALLRLGLDLGTARGTIEKGEAAKLSHALMQLPRRIQDVLDQGDQIRSIGRRFASTRDFFYLGRGLGHAVALEGALKLKEIAYVRAEAYAAGEMKHGPIALIEPGVVVIGILGGDGSRSKMLSNIEEVKARGATVILVASEDDDEAVSTADAILPVALPPPGAELMAPVSQVIALQLFAYEIALANGRDVDKPRNLAKTVTVE